MSKYEALRAFLEKQHSERIAMTFGEIETVIGFKLPKSQVYPAWWSNNPTNNVMTKEWLAAGYRTEQVDIEGRKLVFRRASGGRPHAPGFGEAAIDGLAAPPTDRERRPRRHPLFGALKGTVTIAPGTDLTEPADPELADYLDKKYGPEPGERQAS
jgi:hypothetical protein